MDYFNPAAGLPDPNTYANMPGGGFWTGKVAADNKAALQPFRQNALSQQDLALQEAKAKFGEFSSPEAVAARKSQLATQTAQNQSALRVLPHLESAKIAEHDAFVKSADSKTQAEISDAMEKIRQNKGKPAEQFDHDLAALAANIHDAPEAMKPALWDQHISKMKQKGVPIPPGMESYTPENEKKAQLTFQGLIHDVAETQKENAARVAHEYTIKVEEMKDKSQREVAGIHEGGAMARERLRLDAENKNQNPGQAQEADKRLLDSETRLKEYAKKNGFASVEEARAAVKSRIEARQQDLNHKTALELAKIRANISIMPGSPDQGRSAGDLYQEELAKLGGKTGTNETVQSYKQKYPQYKDIPDEVIKKAYKAKTGKDLL